MKARRRLLPRWRVFSWVILAFNAIMLAWIIGAIAGHASTCNGLVGDAKTSCVANNVGVGVGATLLFVFWALGDVILGVLWLVTKPHKRHCPACGNAVRRGTMRCRNCGFDFSQMLQHPMPTDTRRPGW